jgi:penicillin-binding protein 1C
MSRFHAAVRLFMRSLLRVLLLSVLACAPSWASAGEPSFAQVKAAWRDADTLLLDRHGQAVQTVRTDLQARRLPWVPLCAISPALQAAVRASEDRHFDTHHGVDWAALADAAVGLADGNAHRGASTITMQLAGLIDPALALPAGGRSVAGKLRQVAAALVIERQWRKPEILEAYLNLAPFRGEQVGVAALSQTLFQKLPSGLNFVESALAAALLRAPNAAPALVGRRACSILQALGRAPDCPTVEGLAPLALVGGSAGPPSGQPVQDEPLAPHAARQALAQWRAQHGNQRPPAQIASTLDAGLQRFARDALRQQLAEVRDRGVEDGAVVVLDNASGDVLAWVGSSGALSQAAQVDGVLALRQPGSALKPFLYELAIEHRWVTAASVLQDTPERLQTGAGLYIPQNYDHTFKGPVTVRTALGASLNVPAVRTLVMVTPDRLARRLVALGLPLSHPGDYYGYSLALGSAEVSLLSLTNAYRALAQGGLYAPPHGVLPAEPSARGNVRAVRAMDAGASFIVADILADDAARVPTFGLGSALATRYAASVKTGTSKDMRDNWCIGFNHDVTVGVWVGNASGAPMHDVSGVTGAAPVWRRVLDEAQRRAPQAGAGTVAPTVRAGLAMAGASAGSPGRPPLALQWRRVTFQQGIEPARREWFLPGTAQSEVRLASPSGVAPRPIVSPQDGVVLALDPDIPHAAQSLRFAAVQGLRAGAFWQLDAKRLGPARAIDWPLWPGRHRLALVGADQQMLDEVQFEVRGAELAAADPSRPRPRAAR